MYSLDLFIGLVKIVATVKLNHGALQKCHKKVLKIYTLQTLILFQS